MRFIRLIWLSLELSADAPTGLLAIRLNDVAPDGASTRVSYGLVNLTHRDGHASPSPVPVDRNVEVRVKLNDIAHAFPVGHRIRLAISTSHWPIAWPAPQVTTVTLVSGVSTLELPVRPPDPGDDALRAFALPEVAPGPSHKPLRPLPFQRTVELDLPTNEVVYTLSSDGGEFGGHSLARLEDIGMDLGYTLTKCHRIAENDPLTAKTEIKQTVQMRRDAWRIRIASRVSLGASGEHLHFSAELHAFENDEPFESRSWNVAIPRKLF